MRKILLMLLALLLCGCAGPELPPETTAAPLTGTMTLHFLQTGDVLLERNGQWLLLDLDGETDDQAVEETLAGVALTAVLSREDPQAQDLDGVSVQILAAEETLLALMVRFGETAVLLVQGEEAEEQRQLLQREDLRADVLYVSGRIQPELAEAAGAKTAVAAEPGAETERLLEAAGVSLLRTEECGPVQAISDGASLFLKAQLHASSAAASAAAG